MSYADAQRAGATWSGVIVVIFIPSMVVLRRIVFGGVIELGIPIAIAKADHGQAREARDLQAASDAFELVRQIFLCFSDLAVAKPLHWRCDGFANNDRT